MFMLLMPACRLAVSVGQSAAIQYQILQVNAGVLKTSKPVIIGRDGDDVINKRDNAGRHQKHRKQTNGGATLRDNKISWLARSRANI